jgi:phosphoserine phosphatase
MNFLIKNQDLHGLKDFLRNRNQTLEVPKNGANYSCIVINDNVRSALGENIKKLVLFKDINRTLDTFSLMVCDMDSTLIQNECIDEIASFVGKKNEVAKITEEAMSGKLSFAESLKKRVAMLSGIDVKSFDEIIRARITFQPHVYEWIDYAKNKKLTTVIVSGGFEEFVNYVKNSLKMDYGYANKFEIRNNLLTGQLASEILDANKKAILLNEHAKKMDVQSDQVIAIGDGANDIAMFEAAGLSIAMHGKDILKDKADWFVSDGFFKTVIDLFKFYSE